MVVAGHESPDFEPPQDSKFKLLSLEHPLPPLENGYYLAAIKDKIIKSGGGLEVREIDVESPVRDET